MVVNYNAVQTSLPSRLESLSATFERQRLELSSLALESGVNYAGGVTAPEDNRMLELLNMAFDEATREATMAAAPFVLGGAA